MALYRSSLGLLTLIAIVLFTNRKIGFDAIKRKLPVLLAAGGCLTTNWIFLFAAYAQLKVSVASLFNYMAPIIAVAIAAIVLKNPMTIRQTLCVIAAFIGIIFVSGVFDTGESGVGAFGVFLGVMAAMSFVGCIFCNKALKEVNPIDSMIVQLLIVTILLLPYVFIRNGNIPIPTSIQSVAMLLFIGIVSSGFAYLWYYGTMPYISVQTIAILGYLEPVVCVLLSVFLFKEPISFIGVIGAIMIIGATIISEIGGNGKSDMKKA